MSAPDGIVCHYCQEPGTGDRPLERLRDHDAASGPGLTLYAHEDCPNPEQLRKGTSRRTALEEAVQRRIRGQGCAY